MKGKNHIRMAFLLLILYLPIFPWRLDVSPWEFIFVILVTTLPDSDLKFRLVGHRWFFFHSIIIPGMTLISSVTSFKLLLCLSIGLHCLCDISFKKKGGTFTIKLLRKGLNFGWSNFWLIANFLLSVILFMVLI